MSAVKELYQSDIYDVIDMPAVTSAVKSTRIINSIEPLILPLLAVLEVSFKIACNYIDSYNLLHQAGTQLSDYPFSKMVSLSWACKRVRITLFTQKS